MNSETVLHLVQTYRMITPSVLGHVLYRRNTAKACRVLAELAAAGRLHCHEFRTRDAKAPVVYYTVTLRPLRPDVLHGAFAVLWFCCMTKPRKPLLTPHKVRKLTADIQRNFELRLVGSPRCYITPTSEGDPRKVSLVRVNRPPRTPRVHLNDVIADLDAFVCRPVFELWRHFTLADRFLLTYLVQGTENVAELSTWLQRRPPVSRAGDRGIPIPVHVSEARPIIPP
ncbi:MAG: hypothetical protein JXQ75_15625 [Phycisphaerae bacterium]|nr:hypothetical protein [Phycisphaerae bacterium]